MPILSIIQQPASGSINAAYRPVLLTVKATASNGDIKPPVVYCDIYIGGVFYKTLSKSQYTKLNVADSEWSFDIQDACQESMRVVLGDNGGNVIYHAGTAALLVNCLFRSSGINSNGFIDSDGIEPIQATGGTPAVNGTGTTSYFFAVINATLQHEDNQDLASHLNTFKIGTWHSKAFPLSHRPSKYKLCRNDSDYFPFVDSGLPSHISKLRLNYRLVGQSTWRQLTSNLLFVVGVVLYLPNGPKNLASLFAVDFKDVQEYFVEALAAGDAPVVRSTNNLITGCCEDDKIRLHFVNYLGTIDAINFKLITKQKDPKSSTWERPLLSPLDKAVHSLVRFNVKSNTTFNIISTDYSENQMDWIEELFDTGLAWMEWTGTQGQQDSYIPITITDKSFVTRKEEERYIYELAVEFRLSHEKILLRN